MIEEVWKKIPDYNYDVSNLGRVRNHTTQKIRSLNVDNEGYIFVTLSIKGVRNKRKWFNVHRLVAQAFIPNPSGLPEVNHKDENKTNNCVDNLEWCERKYNVNYGTAQQRAQEARSEYSFHKRPVAKYTLDGILLENYESLSAAARSVNGNSGGVQKCASGKRSCYKGFVWRYM